MTDSAVAWLRTPQAIRERCGRILAAGRRDALAHFRVDENRVAAAATCVIETIRESYPDLTIPHHSRWRHFGVGGTDRAAQLDAVLAGASTADIARARFDLAIVSVLLDAGAGAQWRFAEAGTGTYTRSEGLAVASFHLVASGRLSADGRTPFRVDGDGLRRLDDDALGEAMQVGPDNPLVGLAERAALLRRLGAAIAATPSQFGGHDRPGGLFDEAVRDASARQVRADRLLARVLDALAPIWPARLSLAGEPLGDVWAHPAAGGEGPTQGLVPLHKLSQWLCYSLIEPLEGAGYAVEALDDLTALAEYRNGGLLIDTGVLVPRHPDALERSHEAGSQLVVEWRALTVPLIDAVAADVRTRLGLDAARFPLTKVLEGGTWRAGRRLAQDRRGGEPPVRVSGDGTVF